MIRKCMIIIGLSIALSACAAKYATGPLFSEAPPPPLKKSILYIYRVDSPLVWTPIVRINDKPFVELAKLGYSYTYLSPGIYKLTIEYGGKASAFITEFFIEEGQEVFKKYYDSGSQKLLTDLPKTKALDEIKEYRYIEPLNTRF